MKAINLFDRGFIAWGRDWYAMRSARIEIGLGRRKNPPEGEVAYRNYFSISWNWLPDLQVCIREFKNVPGVWYLPCGWRGWNRQWHSYWGLE